ncbi:tyrosine-type recombinase/integrase [Dermatophilaceae bacterium Soc4.6]
MAQKRAFGQMTKLPSKRYRARYTGPDTSLHNAPHTFETRMDAEAWLTDERRLIVAGSWTPPRDREARIRGPLTFGAYAKTWLADRDLKPRTRQHYGSLLRYQLAPLDDTPLRDITPAMVRRWHASLDETKPTLRAHSYSLLRAILATAVQDEEMVANPCHITGAGAAKRVKTIKPATLAELEDIVREMPPRYRLMTLLASWCALRFGELVELRRRDLDLTSGLIHVRRGAVRAEGKVIVGTPKSAAGIRDVAIPPHLMPLVREHLSSSTIGRDGLLFPAADGTSTLAPSTLYRVFYRAREAAGRPDLRWHDLRHTGAVLAAQTGATLAELMNRLGHSTPQAALRYQHAAQGRDAQIAAALSRIAEGAN